MTTAELKRVIDRVRNVWSGEYSHAVYLWPKAMDMKAQINAVCDGCLAMVEERNRLRIALWKIQDEVTHKKGGVEKDDCVSVPYLFDKVNEVGDLLIRGTDPTEFQS